MLQASQTSVNTSQSEQALSNELKNVQGQIEQGLDPNARLKLNPDAEHAVGNAVKNLLNLPDGATITIKPGFATDKLGRPTSAMLYGTLSIPQGDGSHIRLAYGIDHEKGIFIGSELPGNQSMRLDDLNQGIHFSWNDAKESLPLILEGTKAAGKQIPIMRAAAGEVILMNSDASLTGASNSSIGASVLRDIHIVSKQVDGSLKVENPIRGERKKNPQSRKEIELGIVEYVVTLETADKQYQMLANNTGNITSSEFSKKTRGSAMPTQDNEGTLGGAGSHGGSLSKDEQP